MSSVQIFDNFLPEDIYQKVKDRICGERQPWYYQSSITNTERDNPPVDKFGFNFSLKRADEEFGLSDPDIRKTFNVLQEFYLKQKTVLKKARILRTRLDMTTYSKESVIFEPHVDLDDPHLTSIFYVNDSDGNTVIYNEKWHPSLLPNLVVDGELSIMEEIEPVGNRLIAFDGYHMHTGHNPSKHSNRILINTNFAL